MFGKPVINGGLQINPTVLEIFRLDLVEVKSASGISLPSGPRRPQKLRVVIVDW
jgi:hypothetical protein